MNQALRGSRAILVVDDNRDLAENVAELFEGLGHQVRTANSVQEAREALERAPCDLAVVDIRLHDGSGVELAAMVKRLCSDAEVILMTGDASLDTAIAAIHGDAFAYVQKPFEPEELTALGERALVQVALRRERAQLQRELAKGEALYRGVVDAVDAFIVGLDEEGKIAMWNRCAAESTDLPAHELLGQPFSRLLSSERSRVELAEALERALGGEEVSGIELPVSTRGGDQRIVRWTLSRLAGREPAAALVLAAGIDLTDRIELERRAAEAEAMAALGNLTAGLAHEIRNPLNAAVLQLELLQRATSRLTDDALRERMELRIKIVREEIERLTHLLNDFLDLAKPRAVELFDVDLRQLVSEVAALHEPGAKQAGLSLRLALEDGALCARGNAAMLKQVLGNLVVNAIEAMRERGHGSIELGCHKKSETRVELSVEDDGPGIPEPIAARLFSPFVTSKQAGTGLGLTIVKRIVDRHGGAIHVASAAGRGTTVRISLERGAG
ncbi:MAG: ATP-binding protein [Polyangiales bacterium]